MRCCCSCCRTMKSLPHRSQFSTCASQREEAATSEAFVMGAKGGLDPEVMVNAINAGSGRNGATLTVMPNAVLDRSFGYGAALHILMKDIDLAISQGEELGVPMWVCQEARLIYKHAMFKGAADDDISTLVRRVERRAGFEMP